MIFAKLNLISDVQVPADVANSYCWMENVTDAITNMTTQESVCDPYYQANQFNQLSTIPGLASGIHVGTYDITMYLNFWFAQKCRDCYCTSIVW